jgi:hypothetical protein
MDLYGGFLVSSYAVVIKFWITVGVHLYVSPTYRSKGQLNLESVFGSLVPVSSLLKKFKSYL